MSDLLCSVREKTLELIDLIKEDKMVEDNKNKITGLWKSLDQGDLPGEDILSFNKPFRNTEETVLYLLVHFLVERDCMEVLEEFQKEYQERGGRKDKEEGGGREDKVLSTYPSSHPAYLSLLVKDHLLFKGILRDMEGGNFSSLGKFISENPTSKSLEFYFSLFKFISFISSGNLKDSLLVLLKEISKFPKTNLVDCKKFLKLLLLKGEDPGEVKGILRGLFIQEYSRLKLTSEYDFLGDVLLVGSSAFSQLRGVSATNIHEEDDVLPVEVRLPRGFNYHSLFVCPVLKVLCGDDNKAVLLSCNHVISLSAANVLSKFGSSDSFKCPYCPEMCNSKANLILEL